MLLIKSVIKCWKLPLRRTMLKTYFEHGSMCCSLVSLVLNVGRTNCQEIISLGKTHAWITPQKLTCPLKKAVKRGLVFEPLFFRGHLFGGVTHTKKKGSVMTWNHSILFHNVVFQVASLYRRSSFAVHNFANTQFHGNFRGTPKGKGVVWGGWGEICTASQLWN